MEIFEIPKATLHRLLNDLADERLTQFDECAHTWASAYYILEMANRIWTHNICHEDKTFIARRRIAERLMTRGCIAAQTASDRSVGYRWARYSKSIRHAVSLSTCGEPQLQDNDKGDSNERDGSLRIVD